MVTGRSTWRTCKPFASSYLSVPGQPQLQRRCRLQSGRHRQSGRRQGPDGKHAAADPERSLAARHELAPRRSGPLRDSQELGWCDTQAKRHDRGAHDAREHRASRTTPTAITSGTVVPSRRMQTATFSLTRPTPVGSTPIIFWSSIPTAASSFDLPGLLDTLCGARVEVHVADERFERSA